MTLGGTMYYEEEFKRKVVDEVLGGMPITRAARAYKIERHTIQKWVRRETGLVAMPSWDGVMDERKLEAVGQVEAGVSAVRVAQAYGVAEQTVRRWVADKKRILAVCTVRRIYSGAEEATAMPTRADEKDMRLQNRSLKEENEFLKAKVAYLEELMRLGDIHAHDFKKKAVTKRSTESSDGGKGR